MCWYDVHHRLLSYWVMRIPGVVGKSTEFNVDIFSSETGKWSQSASVCPCGFDWGVFAFPPGVPYNGLFFWWSSTDCLVRFNPYTGKCCQFFEKPVDLNRSYGIFECLGVFHGNLRICKISGYSCYTCLRVWDLKAIKHGCISGFGCGN